MRDKYSINHLMRNLLYSRDRPTIYQSRAVSWIIVHSINGLELLVLLKLFVVYTASGLYASDN